MAKKDYILSEAIEIGLKYHRAGRLGEAENVYRKVLKAQPENAPLDGILDPPRSLQTEYNLS